MAQDATNPDIVAELESALAGLEQALNQASRSVTAIRDSIGDVASISARVQELEQAIDLARQSLSVGPAPAITPTPIRAASDVDADVQPAREQPIDDEPAFEAETEPAPISNVPQGGNEAHCLRLNVSSKTGSLDLKAVDAAVNENPAVIDVALLDYDGRRATLKLWVNASADAAGVSEALLGSLRERLGERDKAEVKIDFEEAA